MDCAATMFKIMLESSQSSLSEDAAAPLDRMYTFILEDAAKFDMAKTGGLLATLQIFAAILFA